MRVFFPLLFLWNFCCLPLDAASLQARSARHYAQALPMDASLLHELKGVLQKRLQADFDQPLRLEWTSHTHNYLKTPIRLKNFHVKHVQFEPYHKGFISDVLFLDETGKEYPISLSGRVVFMKRVPIFKEALSPGDVVNLEKLTWQPMEEDYRLRHVITDPETLKGAVAKARIQPGDMPNLKTVKTTHLVEKGDPVELIYESPHLYMSTPGIALSRGHIGDSIFVSHAMAKRGQKLSGVIDSGRRVRISMRAP